MSKVCLRQLPYELAALGADNPLPDFQNVSYVHSTVVWDDTLTDEDVRYMRYGRVNSILPYLTQDGYTRDRTQVEMPTIVLENEYVKASFLPWMGGRLWSLICDGRELLHVNPVVQPGNLALRNAWCAGGVEWNVSIRGHNMLTCEPLFTETFSLSDGTACARFYEYERIRGIVYRIEAYLPPESHLLFVKVKIENPKGNGEVPMYWWSNIAVPEENGTRIIAPAKTAVLSLYDAGQYRMLRVPLPDYEAMDLSRPCEISRSVDVFFDIEGRPYITALQSDHTGLIQFSTRKQFGRKLFVWGMSQGGRHWQKFLSDGEKTYIEIQAGIAKTQQDHIPMPDDTVWEWLEAYGSLTCDIDGLCYAEAVQKCTDRLNAIMTQDALDAEYLGRSQEVSRTVGEIVYNGSGWGALENLRRGKTGLPPISEVCRFPDATMGKAQAPWKALLDTGRFPDEPAQSYMISEAWRKMLRSAPKNAAMLYQLGVMTHAEKDPDQAELLLLDSLKLREDALTLRALARICSGRKDTVNCIAYYRRALNLWPDSLHLTLEYLQTLSAFGRHEDVLSQLAALPQDWKEHPRFLYLKAASLVKTGRYDEAEAILKKPLIIPDMREGELSLCDVWFELYMHKDGLNREEAERRHPLPEALDFRMH